MFNFAGYIYWIIVTKLVKFRMRTIYTNISLFGYVNRINTKELDTQVDTSEIKHIKQLF